MSDPTIAAEVRLRLEGGPTALARACHLLRQAGCPCRILAAGDAASPCGLAVAVPAAEAEGARALLEAAGLRAPAPAPTPAQAGRAGPAGARREPPKAPWSAAASPSARG